MASLEVNPGPPTEDELAVDDFLAMFSTNDGSAPHLNPNIPELGADEAMTEVESACPLFTAFCETLGLQQASAFKDWDVVACVASVPKRNFDGWSTVVSDLLALASDVQAEVSPRRVLTHFQSHLNLIALVHDAAFSVAIAPKHGDRRAISDELQRELRQNGELSLEPGIAHDALQGLYSATPGLLEPILIISQQLTDSGRLVRRDEWNNILGRAFDSMQDNAALFLPRQVWRTSSPNGTLERGTRDPLKLRSMCSRLVRRDFLVFENRLSVLDSVHVRSVVLAGGVLVFSAQEEQSVVEATYKLLRLSEKAPRSDGEALRAPVLLHRGKPRPLRRHVAVRLPNRILRINQQPVDLNGLGTGTVVWGGARLLATQLSEMGIRSGSRTLEVGAGTGLVSIAAAWLGADVVCTDLDATDASGASLLELTRHNVCCATLGACGTVVVRALSWGDEPSATAIKAEKGEFDFVVGSDVLYDRTVFPLLLQTLQTLCGMKTQVVLTVKCRHQGGDMTQWEHEPFQGLATSSGWQCKHFETTMPGHDNFVDLQEQFVTLQLRKVASVS